MKATRDAPQRTWSRTQADRRVLTRDPDWAAEWISRARLACHPKQLDFVDDPSDLVTALCARGAGKTTGALVRLLQTMGRTKNAPCAFIATTKETAKKIIWRHLKNIVEKLGLEVRFSESELTMTLVRNGSILELAGADDQRDVDKLRGRPFAGVVIDEAASHPPSLLAYMIDEVVAPRIGELDGWIALIGTPGNFLNGYFYDATRPGSKHHRPYGTAEEGWRSWSSHHWNLKDGAPHVRALAKLWDAALRRKEAKGWSDDHPVWKREYLGLWAADNTTNIYKYRPHLDDGSEWNVWDPEMVKLADDLPELAKLPDDIGDDVEHVYIVDQGHADPLALNILAFSPTDPQKRILHRYCFEKQAMYARPLAQILIGEELKSDKPRGLIGATGWPVAFVGDASMTLLDELKNVYGIRIIQAVRHREKKFAAIELTNGDLVEGRIKVLAGSHMESQLLELQWQETDTGDLKENKAQANHSSDCLAYGRLEIARLFEDLGTDSENARPKRPPPGRRARAPDDPGDRGAAVEEWGDLLASGQYDDGQW